MRVERLFRIAFEDSLEARRVRESEDAKTVRKCCELCEYVSSTRTYFGVDFGAQTTANDSGSMRWKPECVCKSTDDIKPINENKNRTS